MFNFVINQKISAGISGQEYIEEFCILVVVGARLLITKLYACCIVSGAYNQARDISDRSDPLSRVRAIPQPLSTRLQVAQPMVLDTYVRDVRYAQLNERNRGTFVTEKQDAGSQTYHFPQKCAVIDL